MPKIGADETMIIKLYQRCRRWKTLPGTGGLLQQNEKVMELLDVVDDVVEEYREKRHQEQIKEMRKRG